MKVKVKARFSDKFNFAIVYNEGMEVEFEDERAKQIIALGLADPIGTPKAETPEPEPQTDVVTDTPPVEEKKVTAKKNGKRK